MFHSDSWPIGSGWPRPQEAGLTNTTRSTLENLDLLPGSDLLCEDPPRSCKYFDDRPDPPGFSLSATAVPRAFAEAIVWDAFHPVAFVHGGPG